MQGNLSDHMRVFAAGDVSVQSLRTAAEMERVDRQRADKVLMLIAGWENGRGAMGAFRSRVRDLI